MSKLALLRAEGELLRRLRVPKASLRGLHYQNKMEELKDETPFNCIITGPTKCGKTKYLVRQLRGPFRYVFEYIILICPTYVDNETYRGFARGDPRFIVLIPDASSDNEIQEILRNIKILFSRTKTLIILDDCAVSNDLKKRSNKFVDLAFSGRHGGFSVWVLTQQLTSISKPFRDNVACVISFYNTSQVGMDTLFRDYGRSLKHETREKFCEILKENAFSRLCFSLRHPFEAYLEIPAPEEWH